MNSIEFETVFIGKKVKVDLRSNFGGPEGWYINIGGHHHGRLFYRDGMWQAHLNDKSELTSDDIAALGERIDADCE